MGYAQRCYERDEERRKESGWSSMAWVGINYADPENEAEELGLAFVEDRFPQAIAIHVYDLVELVAEFMGDSGASSSVKEGMMDKEQLAADLRGILDDREKLKKEIAKLQAQLRATGGRDVHSVAAENVELKQKVAELRSQLEGHKNARRKEKKQIEALRAESWKMNREWVRALRAQADELERRLTDLRESITLDEDETDNT